MYNLRSAAPYQNAALNIHVPLVSHEGPSASKILELINYKFNLLFNDHFTVDLLLMILINFILQYYFILCLSSVIQLFPVHMRF